jgi:hypothetical protein
MSTACGATCYCGSTVYVTSTMMWEHIVQLTSILQYLSLAAVPLAPRTWPLTTTNSAPYTAPTPGPAPNDDGQPPKLPAARRFEDGSFDAEPDADTVPAAPSRHSTYASTCYTARLSPPPVLRNRISALANDAADYDDARGDEYSDSALAHAKSNADDRPYTANTVAAETFAEGGRIRQESEAEPSDALHGVHVGGVSSTEQGEAKEPALGNATASTTPSTAPSRSLRIDAATTADATTAMPIASAARQHASAFTLAPNDGPLRAALPRTTSAARSSNVDAHVDTHAYGPSGPTPHTATAPTRQTPPTAAAACQLAAATQPKPERGTTPTAPTPHTRPAKPPTAPAAAVRPTTLTETAPTAPTQRLSPLTIQPAPTAPTPPATSAAPPGPPPPSHRLLHYRRRPPDAHAY